MLPLPQVKKSPSDNRLYRAIKLQNGIECLLVHDVDALKSSAALSMGVGSFKDPLTAQGIAHYLEHMLFMGTTKYPDQNDYSNFITKNGGSNNAYTSQQQTNYMLEVTSSAFEPALDRFAQFFISPLIKQSSAQKQLEAVHSQHQKNLLNDSWRKYQLSKFISKQEHPYHKFSTGDKNSLASQNLQQILHQFYNQNYSANLMKLVIYSQFDLDTAQKWATQKFNAIPNKNLTRFGLTQHPYDSNAFKKLYKVIPVKDYKKLQLTWILPNQKQHYRNHPGSYVSNLIGHQGKGSILSYLIKQGLATSLSSGNYDSYNCYTQFSINIDLTEKGLGKVRDIIGYILYYIKMLKQKQCPQWFFEQLKLVNKLKFQYMDKKKGMSQTSKMAKNMHQRNIDQLIIYPYLTQEWKPELIRQYLNALTLDNLFVFLQAQKFESQCTSQQPIYKTKFLCEQLGDLQPLECDVSLPQKNIFIPKDLSVLPLQVQKLPSLIYQSEFLDTFFKRDHVFGLPKANINLRLIFAGNFSVTEDIGRSLLLDMLKESLRQFVYLAEMAQIQVQINFVSYFSMDIKFKGFRDSLKLFVVQYLNKVFSFVPTDEQLFHTLIQKHRRKYANLLLGDPYRLAYDRGASTMRYNTAFSDQQKLNQIQNLTFEEVIRLNKCWKKKLFGQSYFSGNITEQQTKQISQSIQKFLQSHSKPLKKQHIGQMRPARLNQNKIPIVQMKLQNANEQNSSVNVHYQVGQLQIRTQILLKLTELVAKQPAFDFLRTQSQLGYIVFCLADDNRGVGGLSIIIQSSVKSSYNLIGYIDTFINQKLKQIIGKLTQEEFNTYRNALKNIKQEKDKNLAAETLRYWSQIVKHQYLFEKKQKQIELIPQITLAELVQFIQNNIFKNQKRIEIHMTSSKKQAQNNQAKNQRLSTNTNIQIYNSPQQFNRKFQLYPDFYAPHPRKL